MNKALGIFGVALSILICPAGRARAFWEAAGEAQPMADHVVRHPTLNLFIPPTSPVEDLVAAFKVQEARRLRALRDEYPTAEFWTGRYDQQQLREWQRRVIRQQGDAFIGAVGDAALARCERLPFCQNPVVRAGVSILSAVLNGVHYHTPVGPFQARLDAPTGLKAEIRRVRVSLEYRVVF